jgi:hypothetical protein
MRDEKYFFVNTTDLLKELNINLDVPCTILGVGSVFLGQPDSRSDVDVRVFVSDALPDRPVPIEFVLDGRTVSARFLFEREMKEHLEQEPEHYLWSYNNANILGSDGIDLTGALSDARCAFRRQLTDITRQHYTEARAGMKCAQEQMARSKHFAVALDLHRGLSALLKTTALLHDRPFPRSKWLSDFVSEISDEASDIVRLSERANQSLQGSPEACSEAIQRCKDALKVMATRKYPNEGWAWRWWEHLTT